jgi:tetratricopeptide (TPR) repeat protein
LEIRALSGLAGVAEARRQFENAEARLTELLRLESQHAQAHFRLGNVLFAMGRPDEALRELRTAAELLDSAPSPSLTLAELYRQAGNLEEAERWIARAAQDSPEDARPQLAMARWQLEKRNDPEAALAFVERAAGLSANGFEALLLRGLVAWSQGKLDQAEEIFESLALKQPGNPQVNNYLAAVLAEQDEADRRRAWELVQLTASLGFQSADTSATLGWVAYHLGELAQAEQQLQKAVAGAGASRDAKYYLARTLFRRGQVAEAQRLLHEALAAEGLFVHIREAQQWQRGIGEPSN